MQDEISLNPSDEASPVEQEVQYGPRWAFSGKDGLRAGWSALLFIIIILGLGRIVTLVVKAFTHGHRPDPNAPVSPVKALIAEVVSMLLVLAASWIMARIEKRRLAVYGYAGRARLVRFLSGCGWGFVALSALVAVLWKTHLLAFDAGYLHGFTAWKYAAAWLLVFIFTGLFEESLLRGYLQYTLTRGIGFWWGALLMSILFGAIHGSNKGESPVGLFAAGAVGLVFCISL
ncbi:MAG TPA: CPBP family intramembrane glutamic endopeptidase, partial [Terriglobales bacterium]|nr:CPBP family intramembrane glutamic endopeptidase [Terriglobales bacterium]